MVAKGDRLLPGIVKVGTDLYGPGHVVGVTRPGHCGHDYPIGDCPICWPVVPTVTPPTDGTYDDSVETHPAYAQIGVHRVSGRTRLYGSDFEHQHWMTVTVRRSELRRKSVE